MKSIKLMTHVVVGYPILKETSRLIKIMAKYADFIELQIPFSDPLADGPTIMRVCEQSLRNGTTVLDALKLAKQLSGEVTIPLLFMCYFNTVFTYGVEKFVRDSKQAGIYGLIVPDMPLEEEVQEHFYEYCRKYDLPVIFVVSPITPQERLREIAKHARAFVYATARQGITGVQDSRFNLACRQAGNQELRKFLKRVRKYFSIPIAVGFGLSTREQVQVLQGHADIAVVGSALIDVINRKEDVEDFLTQLSMVE